MASGVCFDGLDRGFPFLSLSSRKAENIHTVQGLGAESNKWRTNVARSIDGGERMGGVGV